MRDLIKLINQFETKESKLYWIDTLHISDNTKGKLIYILELYK